MPPQHHGLLARREFQAAFNRLSAEHREVLMLVGASGDSYDEAGQMIGLATGTVKGRASRARTQLATLLGLTDLVTAGIVVQSDFSVT